MNIQRLAVTGDKLFLKRHGALIDALRASISHVDPVETGTYYRIMPGLLKLLFYRLRYGHLPGGRWSSLLLKSRRAFDKRSREAARIVEALPNRPDHILHIHAMYTPSPASVKNYIPYSIFVDYTTAQSNRIWEPWSPHKDRIQARDWMDCQRTAFERATHICTFSCVTRDSVRDDYGIPEEKITVVGSAADSRSTFEGHKPSDSTQVSLRKENQWVTFALDDGQFLSI